MKTTFFPICLIYQREHKTLQGMNPCRQFAMQKNHVLSQIPNFRKFGYRTGICWKNLRFWMKAAFSAILSFGRTPHVHHGHSTPPNHQMDRVRQIQYDKRKNESLKIWKKRKKIRNMKSESQNQPGLRGFSTGPER